MEEVYLKAIISRIENNGNRLADYPQVVQDKLEMIDGKLNIKTEPVIEVEIIPTLTLEERITAIEQVTEEVITVLNDKNIIP